MENETTEEFENNISEDEVLSNEDNTEFETGDDTSIVINNANDNIDSSSDTSEIALIGSQFESIITQYTLMNNLLVIQVMFLFTLFIYLFIHFSLERRDV